nr:hypothetical protein [Tanacetum cinerariifolium]
KRHLVVGKCASRGGGSIARSGGNSGVGGGNSDKGGGNTSRAIELPTNVEEAPTVDTSVTPIVLEEAPTVDTSVDKDKAVADDTQVDKGKVADEDKSEPKKNIGKPKLTVNDIRIYVKNRGRSERIANTQMSRLFQFDQHGAKSTPNKSFDISDYVI